MDFENKQDEGRDWRDDRRRWREERHKRHEERAKYYRERWMVRYQSRGGNVWTGVFLLLIGTVALMKVTMPDFPGWLWSWQSFTIAVGLFIGIRHGFRGGSWFILVIIGAIFLIKDFYSKEMSWEYVWPAGLILLGLFVIFKPRRHRFSKEYTDQKVEEAINSKIDPSASSEDYIDSTSIFGGVKKNIISKNFKGGDITNIMGGSEIDLTQADINGTVTIDLTQIFGGTKLIVPSNWQVKAQIAAIFGGVEDKRSAQHSVLDPNKTLILDGTSIFGGIEIKSY